MNQDAIHRVHREIEQNFEELFDKIFRYLRIRISTNEDAEDLATETFIKAWKYAHAYDATQGTILMWLFGITRHEVATHWKNRSIKQTDYEAVKAILQDEGKHITHLNNELDLQRLLIGLSEEQRALVLRHYLDGIPYGEIAQHVGRTESAVRQIVSRAIRTLKHRVLSK